MKYHEDTIAATLKWFEARPLLEDSNKYEEWEDLTPPASDLARAIKYQAQLIRTYLLREADTVEVVTGEPEIGDVVEVQPWRYCSKKKAPVAVGEVRYGLYETPMAKFWVNTIIMRNGKVVLDKREKQ